MDKSINLITGERSFIVNALASFIDVLDNAKRVFPSNKDVQEETTFKIEKAKEIINKIMVD